MTPPGLDPAPPKSTRESTSKVRTGCGTCKARRVKCDEAKPTCRRCAVGGRTCEYNASHVVPPRRRRNVMTIYLPPTQCQPVFYIKDRGLDFFHRNLASTLDGQFDSEFWGKLVLQLSHSEPSIRHAVSAISVICQDAESSLRHPTSHVDANPQAQLEWNRAARSLSARIQAHPDSTLVPLVCCLLFTCIEFLRGNVESSMLHAQSGFNILATLRPNSDAAAPDLASNISPNDLPAIQDHVVPVFSRLKVLCALAGRIIPPIDGYSSTENEENCPHQDLADSRRRLFEVSDACIGFIREASPKAAMFQIDVDDLAEQVKLSTRLDAWCDQLGKLVERMQAAGIPAKQDALYILLVHYKVISIWMRSCTTAGESATDAYRSDFQELLHYAEQIAQPDGVTAATSPPPLLSFELHILGPLYYTALKCRYPAVRRRALEMLRLAPQREGLWNAHYAYITAKRVIELEERHLDGRELPDERWRLHGLPLPDHESRILKPMGEMPLDFQKSDHSKVSRPAYAVTIEAVFQTKPWGLLGEWQTITECIKL